jgi:hypothetical protein
MIGGCRKRAQRTSEFEWSPAMTWSLAPQLHKQLGIDGDAILGADFLSRGAQPALSRKSSSTKPGTEGVNPRPRSAAHECGSR